MTVKLSLLLLALALSAVTITAQDNHRPGKKDLSWGVKANGLRMTAWTSPATDKVFIAVRNFSARKFCYCDPMTDNFTVYARRNAASQWQALTFKTPPQEVTILAICQAISLKPDEEIPSYILRDGVREKKNHSFSLDLREYHFPSEWSGTVEAKIVQSNVYCNQTGNKVGEVESQTFKIRLPFTEAAQR